MQEVVWLFFVFVRKAVDIWTAMWWLWCERVESPSGSYPDIILMLNCRTLVFTSAMFLHQKFYTRSSVLSIIEDNAVTLFRCKAQKNALWTWWPGIPQIQIVSHFERLQPSQESLLQDRCFSKIWLLSNGCEENRAACTMDNRDNCGPPQRYKLSFWREHDGNTIQRKERKEMFVDFFIFYF